MMTKARNRSGTFPRHHIDSFATDTTSILLGVEIWLRKLDRALDLCFGFEIPFCMVCGLLEIGAASQYAAPRLRSTELL